jgi:hypothetical protein
MNSLVLLSVQTGCEDRLVEVGGLLEEPLKAGSNGGLEHSHGSFLEKTGKLWLGISFCSCKKNYPDGHRQPLVKQCDGPSIARQRGNRWSITDSRQSS